MVVDSNTTIIALQSPNIPHTIRPVKLSDIDALRQDCWLHRSITQSQEHLKLVAAATKKKRGLGIIVQAVHNKQIIAYGQMLMLTKCSEISDLIVSESCRSQGIGTAMIQYLVRAFQTTKVARIEIGVAASNPRALALYKKLGFTIAYELLLNLGKGREPVIYLHFNLPAKI